MAGEEAASSHTGRQIRVAYENRGMVQTRHPRLAARPHTGQAAGLAEALVARSPRVDVTP